MKKLLVLLILPFLISAIHAKECTAMLEEEANDNVGMLDRGWESIYEYNQKYGPCIDGGLWEVTSDSVVNMLSKEWDKFPILAKLVKRDKNFKLFIVNNITATVGSDELLQIHENSTKHCPKKSLKLCKILDREALISYKEIKNNQ